MELYIHIPFCVRRCNYCAFDTFAGCKREEMERYVVAILREASRSKELVMDPVETVYIGGGTPSLLPSDLMERMLEGLASVFGLDSVREFTVEANPGTVTETWLQTVRRYGANRISFGVQAVQEHLLRTLGRIHSFDDVTGSVENARCLGFRNINLDLIFGIPGQTAGDWRQTIDAALELSPEHISAYGLIPEEGTTLFRNLESGMLSLPDPEQERDMYDTVIRALDDAGLQQYEISNFARPGFECRHNIGYWDQIPYLGLGISAASMLRRPRNDPSFFSVRWTNPSTFDGYYSMTAHPENLERIREDITHAEARFETVMLSLRMTSGMRRSRFLELHGEYPENRYGHILSRLQEQGLMELVGDSWRLTRRGMDIQNSILVELMDV